MKQLLSTLSRRLRGRHWRGRCAAIRDLAKMREFRAVGLLVEALKDRSEYVRGDAIYAILDNGVCDRRAVAGLIASLKDAEPSVRMSAAYALATIGGKQVVARLLESLADQIYYNEGAAAYALGRLKDPGSVKELILLVSKHPAKSTRKCAAEALGLIKDIRAVIPLIDSLAGDSDVDVRKAAAWALGSIGDSRAVKPLILALRETRCADSEFVRRQAALSLGRIGDLEASKSLKELVTTEAQQDVIDAAKLAGAFCLAWNGMFDASEASIGPRIPPAKGKPGRGPGEPKSAPL